MHAKPTPTHPDTVKKAPATWRQRWARDWLLRRFQRFHTGRLELVAPDGKRLAFGPNHADPRAELRVHDHAFFSNVVHQGEVGFGEAYVKGMWDSDDPPALLRLFILNQDALDIWTSLPSWLGRCRDALRHRMRRNTIARSGANIRAHYDLGNDLYRCFLDENMIYSCAIFDNPSDTLESAQRRKLHAMIKAARIRPGDHVLEIGSGWGGFAIEAATLVDCRVTTITLSPKQRELALERIKAAGLSDRVDVQLVDYRHVAGRYDAIVSIEMIEAVGHEYLGAFMTACDRLLKPNGVVALQCITIPDQLYEDYRHRSDFIKKHVFPGSHLPSLAALTKAWTDHSTLNLERLETIGPHYATTLRAWRLRFLDNADRVRAQGFDDEFIRLWVYYLAYCEAAFATRTLQTLQLTLCRPGCGRLLDEDERWERGVGRRSEANGHLQPEREPTLTHG